MRILLILCLVCFVSCNYVTTPIPYGATENNSPSAPETMPTTAFTFTTVKTYPHDDNAFTQGLVYADSSFYEGTGLFGASSIRKVMPETGELLKVRNNSSAFFGEGITLFNHKIYQITWKSGTCFVYDKNTFEIIGQFTYATEGWGLTHDSTNLIMSDGTANIYFRNPTTFLETRRIQVTDDTGPIKHLNELEYIKGAIYANIWLTDRIAKIDPQTGRVISWIDLTNLLPQKDRRNSDAVLNGIAYDPAQDRLFVTGKWWPTIYEIKLVKQ
ncbi:MAG: glutaminyl-peptide cyclotransferase [Candidatus Latescibacteria bacterium]|jgi:glutaminyl-peptide cyclotransferase|nr:glutaminyl-peptide cyclotransferase [Candidatus Latescibacterota bacterium]MBT4140281.1 glutaminyl-peptide cyclotransferase [Candidatus Latescibacterota bacterium]MBT5828553.1 glutaminyl-peptide cyclotransferase [Candidatus Latescibacterota bacterium]